jgi:hypothetical protein
MALNVSEERYLDDRDDIISTWEEGSHREKELIICLLDDVFII